MNTNRHEDYWTSFNDKRHQNASANLLFWYDFVSFVDNPSILVVTPSQLTTHQSVYWCSFVSIRGSSFPFVHIFTKDPRGTNPGRSHHSIGQYIVGVSRNAIPKISNDSTLPLLPGAGRADLLEAHGRRKSSRAVGPADVPTGLGADGARAAAPQLRSLPDLRRQVCG